MMNPLKIDPTRTTILRKRFIADMRRRFKLIIKEIKQIIIEEDVFGLEVPEVISFNVQRQEWRFRNNAGKITAYRRWLQERIDAGILSVDPVSGKPWTATYIESAYQRGALRAYTDIHREELAESLDFYRGGKEQFIRDSFNLPVTMQKVELLYTRTFEELRGVTATMSQQMSRILSDGLVQGSGPTAIAREMSNSIATIDRTRAATIARTEIVRAHSEGQLDSFERLGVKKIGIMAEWLTAGDERVCEQCSSLEGQLYSVEEARGMLPVHPNCRCAWIPGGSETERGSERKILEEEREIDKQELGGLSNKWRNALTKKEDSVVGDYKGFIYEDINTGLREVKGIRGYTAEDVQRFILHFDRALSKSKPFPHKMITYRGLPESVIKNLKKGDTYLDFGYQSTGLKKAALSFAEDEGSNYVLRMHLPEGMKNYGIYHDEVVLGRGKVGKVLGVEKIEDKTFIDIAILD